MPLADLSPEGRRALLLLLDKGTFTKGRGGYYGGFTTTGGGRPVKGSTLKSLIREGWAVRDDFTRFIRITDLGRIAAETLRREGALAFTHAKRRAPSTEPGKNGVFRRPARPVEPRTIRMPFRDD